MTTIKNASRGALLCLLAVCALVPPALAQSSRIDGGSVSQAKFGFYWETRLEPPSPPMAGTFSTGTTAEPGVIHRYMYDRSQKIYVGYDALVEVLPEPNTYRVTFKQLTMTPELTRQFGGDPWTQMSTPGWGNAQTVRVGDVLSTTLLVNRAANQRVVDYITVQEPANGGPQFGFNRAPPQREFSFATGPSRDFNVQDVELSIKSPRLGINGKLDESSTRPFVEATGPVIWIYVAKRGRFLLSLSPHPELGFRKAGEVRGSSLSFAIGSDKFTLIANGRIAPGQDAYSLYVLHEPDWKPTYTNADISAFNMGAADRAESLLRK